MASPAQAVVPSQLTVRVICDKDHLLTGLFIVFKLKPPKDDTGAWAKVARIVEVNAWEDDITMLLPDATPQTVLAYPWLQPHYATAQGKMIISFQSSHASMV